MLQRFLRIPSRLIDAAEREVKLRLIGYDADEAFVGFNGLGIVVDDLRMVGCNQQSFLLRQTSAEIDCPAGILLGFAGHPEIEISLCEFRISQCEAAVLARSCQADGGALALRRCNATRGGM